ncbi:A/G-specific adenine glycosylase [Microseira sp. BLCC-F43]|jgi:A/G-specific adenine glycosylase|uniref:A/G-specific adenine glycosylase n=1 Tax=Microseira sp. BLCC-F43 TaxID=3153602 RepID=UPI0035BA9407
MQHLDQGKLRWFRHQIKTWAKQHLRNFPWRNTTDPYAIFVAELMLQKTNAALVAPIYQAFMQKYPTLDALAAAPFEEISSILQPLGQSLRVERLRRSIRMIQSKYGGNIPKTEAQLLELPGVGNYTARAICTNAFGQPKAVLDTNVARILERFFGFSTSDRVKARSKPLQQAADQVAPDTNVATWNLALLDFGAAVCTARTNRCTECPLQQKCQKAAFDEKII